MLKRLRSLSGTSHNDLTRIASSADSVINTTTTISTNNNIRSITNYNKSSKEMKEKLKLNLSKRIGDTHNSQSDLAKTDRPTKEKDDENDYSISYSLSAPVSPKLEDESTTTRNSRSNSYIKAVEEASIKAKIKRDDEIKSKELRKLSPSPQSTSTLECSDSDDYYSAYYESEDNYDYDKTEDDGTNTNTSTNTNTNTNTNNTRDNTPLKTSSHDTPTPSHDTSTPAHDIPIGAPLLDSKLKISIPSSNVNVVNDDSEDYSEVGRSPGRVPPRNQLSEKIDTVSNGDHDPPLPDTPKRVKINLPVGQIEGVGGVKNDDSMVKSRGSAKRLNKSNDKLQLHFATLSRTLDLKHPCSPRMMESRQELIEYQKIIGLQTMLFNLRVDFWKIENSRLMAIESYQNLAKEAGLIICENCKRILRNRDRIQKYGNYHVRSINPERPHRHTKYRCTKRTFDDHILNSSAPKYYPIPLERK